ncbi:hypothetical protein ACHAXT_002471 [Thalassiosira profunda]
MPSNAAASSAHIRRKPAPGRSSLQNMGASSASEARFVFAIGLLLSLNSGYINGLCLGGLLTEGGSDRQGVTAFTGTYTKSGLALADGQARLFGFEFTLILSFIGGAVVSGLLNPKAIPHKLVPSIGPTFMLGSLCVIASAIAAAVKPSTRALYYFAAAASGIQNGLTSTYTANLIRTTHLTGTSTDIGLILGQMLRGNWKNFWKCKVLVGLASSFWLGSLISFYAASAFLSKALWFSAALYLSIGLTHCTFIVLTQKVSFVQAMFGTYKWDNVLQRMATSINDGEGTAALADLTPEQVDSFFDQIDADGSGEIDADELKDVLEKMGIKLTSQNVKTMIAVVDVNGDGVVDREEFHCLVNMATLRAVKKEKSRQSKRPLISKLTSSKLTSKSSFDQSDRDDNDWETFKRAGGNLVKSGVDKVKSLIPFGKSEEEKRAAIVKKERKDEIKGGINAMLKDMPLPIRMMGKMVSPLLARAADEIAEQTKQAQDLLEDARVRIVNDPALAEEFGEPIQVGMPFSQSSSTTVVNGKSTAMVRAQFQVAGPRGNGIASMDSNNGQITSLTVNVNGRNISVSSGGKSDDNVIEAEIIEKK